MAAKKRSTAEASKKRPGRYKGSYLRVQHGTKVKSKKSLDEGKILLAIGDADSDGWVPIIFMEALSTSGAVTWNPYRWQRRTL